MAEQLYAIVFRGQLQGGADPAQVRANFAKLFNIDAARVEQMFGGQAVIIKKGLDLLAADKYKAALAKAGAVVEVIDMPGAAAAPAAAAAAQSAPAVAKPTSTPASTPAAPAAPAPAPAATVVAATAAPTATSTTLDPVLARSAPPAALRGTPKAIDSTLAEPGVVLVEAVHVAPPAIATEHLSMAEVGVRIVDYTPPPAPQFDLADLSLAEPGVILSEARKSAAPSFDLSGLSLDESARS